VVVVRAGGGSARAGAATRGDGGAWSYGGGHIGPELAARRLSWDRREIGAEAYDVPVVEAWPGDVLVAAFVGDGSAPTSYDEVAVSNGMIRVPPGNGPREMLIGRRARAGGLRC
jgi:hypothetical protein